MDESGILAKDDPTSRFYIVALVLHEQERAIAAEVERLDRELEAVGIANLCFHAGPLIRQEKVFAVMDRSFRYRIFAAMMAFARHVDFRYRCLVVDKKNVTSSAMIVRILGDGLAKFLDEQRSVVGAFDRVKIYYDCGQIPMTNLLHRTFVASPGVKVEFAQAVRPEQSSAARRSPRVGSRSPPRTCGTYAVASRRAKADSPTSSA